jgi:hypothetical protein
LLTEDRSPSTRAARRFPAMIDAETVARFFYLQAAHDRRRTTPDVLRAARGVPATLDEPGGVSRERDRRVFPRLRIPATAAKAVCAACVVRGECLAYALADPDLVGVWGGTSHAERRALRRAA